MILKEELKYSKSHEWVALDGDSAVVGLTDYAQSELGDLVFVNLPEVGDTVEAGEVFGDVESVKAVSDVYSPVTGEVTEINEELLDSPELINDDAYEAWFIKVKDVSATEELLTAEEYKAFVESEQDKVIERGGEKAMGSYVPNTLEERKKMLQEIGYSSIEDLFAHIPEEVKLKGELNIPKGKTEFEVRREMEQIAEKNQVFRTIFRGAGAYRHFIPAMVKNVTSKENLLTAYTPYQAEISQGILQSIFEYQTMICDLTGMDVSNASVYDGATAAAEGVAMCQERKKHKALISGTVPPYVLEVVETYCFGNGMELEVIPEKDGLTDKEYLKEHIDAQTACVYIQHPNYYGNLEDAEEIGEIVHDAGAKYVMGVNPISLGVIKTPAEYGADVAVGEGQPLGLSLGFGGPYLGFMASKEAMMRKLPGRIVGETVDHNGKTGYVLTLQAREQHIRREKASSNICSNQALCALAVGVYLATMGNEGVRQAAILSMSKAHYFAEKLEEIGLTVCNQAEFFHEFVTRSEVDSDKILRALEEEGILGGYPLDEHHILWCCTEVNTKEEMDQAVHILREVQGC